MNSYRIAQIILLVILALFIAVSLAVNLSFDRLIGGIALLVFLITIPEEAL